MTGVNPHSRDLLGSKQCHCPIHSGVLCSSITQYPKMHLLKKILLHIYLTCITSTCITLFYFIKVSNLSSQVMDRNQEMKLLGFCGILKETFKLIFSHKKLYTQITLAFIIPLSLIFQANIITSHLLISKIFEEKDSLEPTDFNIYKYSNLKFSNLKSFKWAAYWVLSQIAYYIPILILSLLCTSTVVYSVFCNYTAKDVTFKKTIAIVPKIWKQVLCTFLVSFGIVFLYEYVLGAILAFILGFLFKGFTTIIAVVILILYLAGSIYITVIWHLGIVVSVLEQNVYGIKAIKKSKNLVKGKYGVAVGMLLVFSVCSVAIDAVFQNFVVRDDLSLDWGIRIGIGIFCFILLLLLILFGLVVQTVIYFVCKSYLNEDFAANSAMNAPQQKATAVQEQLPV